MTKLEKKQHIQKLMEGGDSRSYNEISADIELLIWTAQYKGKEVLEAINYVHKKKEEVSGGSEEE